MPENAAAAEILQEMREATARLNDVLRKAHEQDLATEISVQRHGIVGRRAELLMITGRVIRARVEFDERF